MLILVVVFVSRQVSILVVVSLVVEPPVVGQVRVVVSTTSTVVVPILCVVLVPTVRNWFEWCWPMPILPPSTLPVGLVIGFGISVPEAAYAPLVGFPLPKPEIVPITNEQNYS